MSGPCGRRGAQRAGAALAVLCCVAAQAQQLPEGDGEAAPQRPKWEAGLGAAALRVADYPASDEYRTLALPLPYFVYHGRVLRSDDEGSRLRRKLAPQVEIDVSGGGALASDSGDSQARAGMPDLGYLVELGPNLRLGFAGWGERSRLVVNLPLRGVVSIGDPDLSWRGVLFAPEIAHRSERIAGTTLGLRISLVSQFASGALADYYYAVAPRYATAQRPAYGAAAGYLSSSLGVRIDQRLAPRLRGFVSLRYYSYAGATNDDSPLFRRDDGYTAALGLSWAFLQSRQAAEPE